MSEEVEIPEDMKPWFGGMGPPDDWDRNWEVLHRNGMRGSLNTDAPSYWLWDEGLSDIDIIAYRPVQP